MQGEEGGETKEGEGELSKNPPSISVSVKGRGSREP